MEYRIKILVIDGQGGRIGRQIIQGIIEKVPDAEVTAVGTNSAATVTMAKGGAVRAATGENAVVVGCRTADVIVGPIGITIADSLLGEITPKMAVAVGQSSAVKILIPVNRCKNVVVGVEDMPVSRMVELTIGAIEKAVNEEC